MAPSANVPEVIGFAAQDPQNPANWSGVSVQPHRLILDPQIEAPILLLEKETIHCRHLYPCDNQQHHQFVAAQWSIIVFCQGLPRQWRRATAFASFVVSSRICLWTRVLRTT
jgi:hypothetical protein